MSLRKRLKAAVRAFIGMPAEMPFKPLIVECHPKIITLGAVCEIAPRSLERYNEYDEEEAKYRLAAQLIKKLLNENLIHLEKDCDIRDCYPYNRYTAKLRVIVEEADDQ